MKEKPIEVRLNEKQIEVYELLIKALQASKQVIRDFDGKVCNVRLEKALKESSELQDLAVYLSVRKNVLRFIVSDYKQRGIKRYPNVNGSSWIYVDYNNVNIQISIDGNRIDASKTIDTLLDCVQTLEIKIRQLKKANDDFDSMVKDYQKIIALIDRYNDDYDASIRQRNYRLSKH